MMRLLKSFPLGPIMNGILPFNTAEVIDLLCTLAEEERLRLTVSSSFKGGLIAGAGSILGGILLGPLGLAVGGAVGGTIAAATYYGRFFPASQVLATMSQEHKDRLAGKMTRIMNSVNVQDIAVFAVLITGDQMMRTRVIQELVDYLKHEMSMALVDR